MKVDTNEEETPIRRPNVNEALRTIQKALEDALEAREEEHDTEMQFYLSDLKREARAEAELRQWKSFARDAWMAACCVRDTATQRLDALRANYGEQLREAMKDEEETPFF